MARAPQSSAPPLPRAPAPAVDDSVSASDIEAWLEQIQIGPTVSWWTPAGPLVARAAERYTGLRGQPRLMLVDPSGRVHHWDVAELLVNSDPELAAVELGGEYGVPGVALSRKLTPEDLQLAWEGGS